MATSMCVHIIPSLKVLARSSVVGMKISRSAYSWTRHKWCMFDHSFLKALCKSCVFFFLACVFYHRVTGSMMEVLVHLNALDLFPYFFFLWLHLSGF
jgi:hypothetical protein